MKLDFIMIIVVGLILVYIFGDFEQTNQPKPVPPQDDYSSGGGSGGGGGGGW